MPETVLLRVLNRYTRVHPEEAGAVLWSFLYFFSLLCGYYIVRPLRDEMGVAAGVENLQWLFTATFVAMLAAVPLFGWVTSRFSRRRFLPLVYYFFIACLLVFFVLFQWDPAQLYTSRAFFIWASVFNLFVVSVFWSFMADLFTNTQARRLFGFIAAGGTLGALAGPALTTSLAIPLGTTNLLLVSAGFLGLAVYCIRRLLHWRGNLPEPDRAGDTPLASGLFSGIGLVVRSPYLLGICLLMLLFTSLATFLYFQQAQIISDTFSEPAERTRVFSSIDLAVNTLTLLLQVFVTGRLVKRLGLAWTLALVPLLLSLGSAVLSVAPVLAVLVSVQVIRRAGNYAIMRPAREMLYVVMTRDEKYKAKNFIDTVVYRGGDVASAWAYTGLRGLGLGLAEIAWLAVPLSLLWAAVAYTLGRRQTRLSEQQRSPPPTRSSTGETP